jgi:hypothetical protein
MKFTHDCGVVSHAWRDVYIRDAPALEGVN